MPCMDMIRPLLAKKQKDDALMRIINEYRAESGEHIYLTGTGGYEMIAAARSIEKEPYSRIFI